MFCLDSFKSSQFRMYLKFLPGISNNISTIKWKQLYSSKIHKNEQLFANKQNVFIFASGTLANPNLKRLEIEPSFSPATLKLHNLCSLPGEPYTKYSSLLGHTVYSRGYPNVAFSPICLQDLWELWLGTAKQSSTMVLPIRQRGSTIMYYQRWSSPQLINELIK